MMEVTVQALTMAAEVMATRGAVEYLCAHNFDVDNSRLTEYIKSRVAAALPKALADVEANLGNPNASAQFSAAMFAVGARAAKEASL